jgi:transposase
VIYLGRTAMLSVIESIPVNRLHSLYATETDVKAKLRLLAALKRKDGWTINQIADDLEKPVMTVHNWLRALDEFGVQRRYDVKRSGRPKRLSAKQLNALRKDLLKPPTTLGFSESFWNTRVVQEHVKRKYGISFVSRHMTRLLHKIGYSLKKPRPSDYRADKAAQRRFKKNSKGWFPNA